MTKRSTFPRSRAALRAATALVASAGMLIVAPASAAATKAACPPAALVEGPVAIATPITSILRQHGIGAGASVCGGPTVRAAVSGGRDARGFLLRVEDRFGRRSERQVATAETAASLIESWALEEDADLLAPRASATIAASEAPPNATSPLPADARVRVLGAAEASGTGDGSTWYGGSATACVSVGQACAGVGARFARTAGVADPLFGGELIRTASGARLVAGLPLRRGRIELLPMLGLGADWVHVVGSLVTLSAATDDVALRAEATVVAQLSIAHGLSVLVEAGGMLGTPLVTDARQGTTVRLPLPPAAALRAGIGIGFSR